jgi:hypothetical protein
MSGWTLVPNAVRLAVALAVMLIAHRVPTPGLTGLLNQGAVVTVNSDTAGGDVVGTSDGNQPVFTSPAGKAGGPSFLALLQGGLLSSLDIYTLWGLLLTAIGAAVTARLGWLKASVATLIYWAASLVLGVVPALVAASFLTLAGPGPGPLP